MEKIEERERKSPARGPDLIKFSLLCSLLDQMALAKSNMKIKMLSSFFERYYSRKSIFGVVRLLLPQLDRERGNYGLKESTLAKFYAEILLLPRFEADRLKFWKNPTKQPVGAPTGDFVAVLMQVMQNRCRKDPVLTVQEVNSLLDELANSFENEQKKLVLA